MNDDDLDNRLRQLANEQADAAPPAHGWSTVVARSRHDTESSGGSSRRWLAMTAAGLIVVVGIGALIVIDRSGSSDDPAPADTASERTDGAGPPPTPTSTTPATRGAVQIDHEVLVDGAPTGPTWTTGLATNTDELAAIWAEAELVEPLPTVDFSTHVVVWFAPAESSSCRFRPLEGVEYDPATGRLYPLLSTDGGPDCTDDANPHTIVVAIPRAALPAPPFDIWVDDAEPPACCGFEVTHVSPADLTLTTSRPTGTGGVDGPVIYAAPASVGETALGVGTIELVNGCLMLDWDSPQSEWPLIVWKFGTTWDATASAVVLPSGDRLSPGDHIELGGGFHPVGGLDTFFTSADARAALTDCAAVAGGDPDVFVVQ